MGDAEVGGGPCVGMGAMVVFGESEWGDGGSEMDTGGRGAAK